MTSMSLTQKLTKLTGFDLGMGVRGKRLAVGMAMCLGLTSAAMAFPSWIGVYGSYERHNDENPGEFEILMNQDYYGLHAQFVYRVDGGSWNYNDMTYAGNVSGNSYWTYSPASAFPDDATVEYYFHGWDNWGGHIYDNVGGSNYTYETPPPPGPVASTRPGMGAIPYSTGTTFRVWAPNADAVSVAGDFNSWNQTANPLVAEGGGTWSVDVEGAVIDDQYLFVITNGATDYWRNDPRAQQVTNSVGNSVIADMGYSWQNSYSQPGFNEMVIYQMHIGTYNDSPGGTPGNFQSAIDKLDHVEDLGANMVALLPVMEFAGDFSWGYNPGHIFSPESIYGTPLDFKEFVDEAHGRGLGVILDVVYNHLGPSDLATWCYDGECYGSGGIYFYNDWRKSTPWGDTRPDYGRGEVRTWLKDNAMYWLDEYRADGLRWDSVVNIRTQNNGGGGDIADGWSLIQYINNEKNTYTPWKISIAEDLQGNDYITKTTGAGGAGFDSQWDADFVHPIRDAIITGSDSNRNMYSVRDAITNNYNGSHTQRVIYTESHDEVANGKARVPEEIWPGNAGSWYSKKRSTLGAAITMTSPGIPMMFQGQEFLEDQYFQDTDPLDWAKKSTYSGIYDLYKDLIKLRRNWYNNTRGLRGNNVNVHHINNSGKVIAYHRWDTGGAGDDVIVVANFSQNTYSSYNIGFPSTGTWYVRFNSDWNGYSGDFGNTYSYDATANWGAKDGMPANGNVAVGPYSVIIMSK